MRSSRRRRAARALRFAAASSENDDHDKSTDTTRTPSTTMSSNAMKMTQTTTRGRRRKTSRGMFRPLIYAAAFGYFFQKHFRSHLLPYGKPVPHVVPRVSFPNDDDNNKQWYAKVDPSNDSLRFRHGRSYKLFDDLEEQGHSLLRGPETILVHPKDQSIYALTETAELVQLTNLPTTKATKRTPQKEYNVSVHTVRSDLGPGRPLGGRFTADGETIYMADAALGLTRLRNWRDPCSKVELVASNTGDQQQPILYANAVAIGPKTGKVYFTDSTDIPPDRRRRKKKKLVGDESYYYYVWDTMYAAKLEMMRGQATGRVCEYDPATDQVRVLAENIQFANGIGVDMHNEEFLVVAETFGTNVLKYDLRQEQDKKNVKTTPMLLEPTVLVPHYNVTGYLDNLDCAWHAGQQQTICYAAVLNEFAKPQKFWRKLPTFLQLMLRAVGMMIPRTWAPKLVPVYAAVLVIDPLHPNRFRYIQDPTAEDMAVIAGVTVDPVDHTRLYLGSLTNEYIGVYELLPDSGEDPLVGVASKEEEETLATASDDEDDDTASSTQQDDEL